MKKLFYILCILCFFSCRKLEVKHAHTTINKLNNDIIQYEPQLIGLDTVLVKGYLRTGKKSSLYAIIVDSISYTQNYASTLNNKEITALYGKFNNEFDLYFNKLKENTEYNSYIVDNNTAYPDNKQLRYKTKSNTYIS